MKIIAMFLPQFHNCPYNNSWWGEGFTEWNNVKGATPQYAGHIQPKVPTDGYYKLDDINEIKKQARDAIENGIYGFSIYHYWYEGRRPLSRPLDLILENPSIDLKFNICWANHSWTRSWKNRTGSLDVLIEQTYETDCLSRKLHEEFLCKVFGDKRYININDKPLFQIYNPENIPDLKAFIKDLRGSVQEKLGKKLHLSAMITAWKPNWEYLEDFDSVTLFQPSLAAFSPEDIFGNKSIELNALGLSAIVRASPHWLKKILYKISDILPEKIIFFSYEKVWNSLINQYKLALKSSPKTVYPMAFVDFDNTPRYKKRARIFTGYSIEKFKNYLHTLIAVANDSKNEIIFLNAWNEWGEGMYLQPDVNEGDARLNAIKIISAEFTEID